MMREEFTPAQAAARGFESGLLTTPKIPLWELVFYHPGPLLTPLPGQLAAALGQVLRELGAASWRCLPYLARPLLGNPRHPYRPVQLARRQLAAWGATPGYRGAYQVPLAATADFIRVLFRISRYDGSTSEYTFLAPETDDFVAYVCKYGNLHVLGRAEQLDAWRGVFQRAGLREWEGREYERFSADGHISGRRIRLR